MAKTITAWGRQCKAQMALHDIKLGDIAKSSGLSRSYISAIINGRIIVPEETVKKINKALRMVSD